MAGSAASKSTHQPSDLNVQFASLLRRLNEHGFEAVSRLVKSFPYAAKRRLRDERFEAALIDAALITRARWRAEVMQGAVSLAAVDVLRQMYPRCQALESAMIGMALRFDQFSPRRGVPLITPNHRESEFTTAVIQLRQVQDDKPLLARLRLCQAAGCDSFFFDNSPRGHGKYCPRQACVREANRLRQERHRRVKIRPRCFGDRRG